MKKRRMKLMALLLALTVSFNSVVPAGAAVSEEKVTVDTVAEPDNTEEAENSVDVVAEKSAEEIQDSNWTVEKVTDADGKITSVIFRKYADAASKTGFEFKWVYDDAQGTWAQYQSDEADAVPEKTAEGIYETGALKKEDTVSKLMYWLGDAGKGKSGWKLSEDGNQFFYYYSGEEKEILENLAELPVGFYLGMQKPSELIKEGYYSDINGDSYWLKDEGILVKNEWKLYKDEAGTEYYYYFGEDGKQDKSKKGLQTINGAEYYLKDDFSLLKSDSVMIDGKKHVFDENGKCVQEYVPVEAGWHSDENGRWYQCEDGTRPENCSTEIDGEKYYFGEDGYIVYGWLEYEGNWYYLGKADDGAMKTGWQKVGGKWYYMDPSSGIMQEGWVEVDGKWYYLKPGNGAMQEGWLKLSGKWYYLNPGNGAMAEGWKKVGGKWYYLKPGDGAMQEGWQKIGSKWYYLTPGNGAMREGWLKLSGKWYYLKPGNGAMAEGWCKVSDKWYYLKPGNGAMVDGWRKVDGKWYYLKPEKGYRMESWQKIGGKWYYLKPGSGAMVTGWNYISGYKLYFNSDGVLVQDVSNMISGPYRIRVNRTRCMVTIFAKDGSNGWIIPVKSMTCSVGLPATPTPTGTFYIGDQDRWHALMGPSWGQYTSHVYQGIFIHSVAGAEKRIDNLNAADYNKLGQPASHGCIRLCVRDAKWIYTNVSRGSQITIGDGYYEPFDKPATIKLKPGTNLVDPTQC